MSRLTMTIRPYAGRDEAAVVRVWNRALWFDPITVETWRAKVLLDPNFDPATCLVGEIGDEVRGFVLALTRQVPFFAEGLDPTTAWISACGVDPDFQRQGYGTALLTETFARLRERGRTRVILSGYVPNYFTPGVDVHAYAPAVSFFERHGFTVTSRPLSMRVNLTGFRIPSSFLPAYEKARDHGIVIRSAGPGDIVPVLQFLREQFSWDWHREASGIFQDLFAGLGDPRQVSVLVAESGGEIVGYAQHRAERFGPFGVREDRRSQGIGRVLLAETLQSMRTKNFHTAWFLWTSDQAARLYTQCGFEEVRRFAVMTRRIWAESHTMPLLAGDVSCADPSPQAVVARWMWITMNRDVRSGLEVFLAGGGKELDGRRIGLVTNPNGVDRSFHSGIELLHESTRVELVALFGPEHGVRGDAQAGAHVAAATDTRTGLPVYSLYGETRRPTPEMLVGLDALVIDLQDLGIRYATYLSTVIEVQKAAHAAGIDVVIFDRPNPLADLALEGNVLEPAFSSFVGSYPIPVRHGMTLGELALLVAHERGWKAPIVIRAEGLTRGMWYDETDLPWILPSPNMPTLDALTLYGGTCLIEGTTLSEGRGTTRPFEFVGAPGIDPVALADDLTARKLPGLAYRPVFFTPMFSKHAGEICGGVQVYCTDRRLMRSVALGIHLLHAVRRLDPEFGWVAPNSEGGTFFVDLLLGSDKPRLALDAGATPDEIMAQWPEQCAAFAERRRSFLLYPESVSG